MGCETAVPDRDHWSTIATSGCYSYAGLAFDLSTSIGRCQTTWAFLHIDDQMESVLGGRRVHRQFSSRYNLCA
ncbi:g7042 [Coccomyxa viridis]|uniref:G7042 protein n=1 Tax=Coccomyxa viridis TaxID=1274662 RepID=A0ABP1G3F7_9CHLO